ncbi:MAG: type II toxin-antitoxin system RelE/ParE family toxin [Leptolyngbyaceae bacterium]|nr:type II toxin-antitoxin system RelE/ParE family toxin [Leptolyngbyaceae bacterium]
MIYQVQLAPAAKRQIKKLDPATKKRVLDAIGKLATDPRPSGVVKLTAEENLYRIRVGSYRVIYEIEDQELVILVVKVGPRRDIYHK